MLENLDEDIADHIDRETQENIERGMTPKEARYAALRKFGNVTRVIEDTREVWGFGWTEQLLQDVRYGLRMLGRSPGFASVAILTLALGIGANTAIFSLINTVVLRQLAVEDPKQLVELVSQYPGEPRNYSFSWQSYEHFRDHNHVFSGLVGVSDSRVNLRSEGGELETVDGEYVVGSLFPVLGVKPAIGRLIGPELNRAGSADSAVAVVSWSYWKNRFNLDPAILGKRLIVDDVPLTIVGVTPREFSGLQVGIKPDVWLPVEVKPINDALTPQYRRSLKLMGRLKPGVSIEQARAEVAVLFEWTIDQMTKSSEDPLLRQLKSGVEPAGAGFSRLRDVFEKPLLSLMGIVGLLLILACTNVSSMLLARAAARGREMALRVSLGAGRFRLLRQVLTESLLLSAAGGLPGVVLAYFGAAALVRVMASGRRLIGLPGDVRIQVQLDARVLLFTITVAVLTGVLFGLAPAWNAFSPAPASSLREIKESGDTRLRRLFGKGLVVGQVALSVVLLSLAGLFIRNLSMLENLDLGFRRDHVLLVTLDPEGSGYAGEGLSHAYRQLLGRFETIPGVQSATLSGSTPISGAGAASFAIVEGYQERAEDRRYVSINWIAPKYFETLKTPILAGRDFRFEDQGGPRVAIINQAMARYYFGDSDPIGKHIALDRDWKGFGVDKPYEIVGLVGDAKYYEIRETWPRTVYFNAFREGNVSSKFALRTSVDPAAVAPEVRRMVREVLKTVRVESLTTLAEQVDASILTERVIAALSGLLGGLGALLAAIGLYGLLGYTVARRINEIGVRMALGASRSAVTQMVLKDALGMVSAGLVIGAPLAFWGKGLAAHLIEGPSAESAAPIVFGAVAMIAIALLAAYMPARRASRVDPMEALRHE
jgi:predicted permease